MRRPTATAISHQPTAISASIVSDLALAASTVIPASAVAAPALSNTVVLRKSTNRTVLQQRLEQLTHAGGPVDGEVRLLREAGGRFVGADGHAQGAREIPGLHERAQAAKRVEVGGVVAD